MKITKTDKRKVELCGLEEGHAIIVEHESYEVNGRRRWQKSIVALTPDELRMILNKCEEQQ